MLKLPTYEVIEELVTADTFVLQRAENTHTKELHLIKKFYHVEPEEINALKFSVGLVQEKRWEAALFPQHFVAAEEEAITVYGNAEGFCLRNYMAKKGKLQPAEFITVATALANMVAEFQAKGWIIKNIYPENIFINPQLSNCQIIDASKATNTYKNEVKLSLTTTNTNLFYISPEQTGMLNRITDHRSDYYSLGIIFYELLTGLVPFENKDPLSLLHAHVAVGAIPPTNINAYVPRPVSNLVLKLLAKNAEDRYQSMQGLLFDLEQIKAAPNNDSFVPGTHDRAGRITISEKLVGRKDEFAALWNAFLLATNGHKQVVYIGGYSGVGKTRLVAELQHKLDEDHKMVVAKFDVMQKKQPYSALIMAMKDLIKKLLKEDETGLTYWRNRLLQFLNGNGQLIINALPELKIIIGEQPEVKALPPEETQNRFQQTIISFIEAFVTDNHFLCIFLDDLQWADIASIQLVELVILNEKVKNFLFVGAYRDNEVDFTHPLIISRKKQEQWVAVKDISLASLHQNDTEELIAGSLQNKVMRPQQLAELIYQKTRGNAFYVLQLLTALYEAKGLYLTASGYWDWDDKALQFRNVNQDVAELLSDKLNTLPPSLIEILKCGACLGDIFDLKTTAHLANQRMNSVAKELTAVINIGYILSLDDNFETYLKTSSDVPDEILESIGKSRFRFAHDRIRQAALTLMDHEENLLLNLRAGKFKLAFFSSEELADELFYLANNFNVAAPLIKDKEEIAQVVDINLQAGIKAKNSTAYDSAIVYFKTGKSYLNFKEHYSQLYTFYLEEATCKFLTGRYEEAETELDFLFEHATSRLDKLNALFQKVYLYTVQDLKVKAVETGRLGYQLYGLHMPKSKMGIMSLLMFDLLKSSFLLTDKNIDKLIERPLIQDKEIERFLEFILSVAPPLYQYDQNLFAWNTMKMVLYSLKYGNNGIASFGYIGYGMIVSQLFKQYKKGKKLADIAISLNNKLEYTALMWKVRLSYYNFVQHWTEPIRPSLDAIVEVINGANANGDPIFAGYAIFNYHQKRFALGFHLSELQQSFEEYLKLVEKKQDIETSHFLKSYLQAILCLRGLESDVALLGKEFNAPQKLEKYIASSSFTVVADTFIAYMSTLYLFGFYEEAYKQYSVSIPYMSFVQTRYDFAEFNFYGALICAQAYELKLAPLKKLMKSTQAHVKQLKTWKNNCPENFEPQYLLAHAVMEGIKGKTGNASALYEQAIASAGKYLFINYKAMACELAGKTAMKTGNQMMAKTYLDNARQCYQQWGAIAKVQQIEQEFGQLLGKSLLNQEEKKAFVFSGDSAGLILLLQTAQTVKSEKDVDRLVEQLMKTVIQYAGADTGYLLIYNQSDLIVKAQYNLSEGVRSVTAYPDANLLPLTVIRYVTRLKEPLIINNPAQTSEYADLTYFKAKQPKSLLCYPVLKQGSLFGILYLENYSSEDVFNAERLNTMHLISSQMAMLLDNAYLYQNMETVVKERVSELEIKMDSSEALLRNIFPKEALQELQSTGKTTAQKFDNVSVLMADIKGFTLISEKLTPEELINKIDLYFRAFDGIMTQYGVEKIKTIGDAYMAVGGLGTNPEQSAIAIVSAAIAMQEFVAEQSKKDKPDERLGLRIGIHTGTVIAGVVGSKKLQYDIWGDTVNVAARMEQNSEPGRINVSKATCEMTANAFHYTYRGKIDAKNKGELDMYFVEEAK